MRVKELSTVNVLERLENLQPMMIARALEKAGLSTDWTFLGLQVMGGCVELRFERYWQHESESETIYLTIEEIEMDIDVWQERVANIHAEEKRKKDAKIEEERTRIRMQKELEFERLRKELGK